MRILVPIDTDHGGKLGCLVSSSTRWFRIMTRDSMFTFKEFNDIGMHYWSTNFIKSWYEMMPPANSVFNLSSYFSSNHMISQLKNHLSIFVYDVKLNAHMSHIYGWWIDFYHNWHDLHCSKLCLSSIIALFFNEIHVEFYYKKIR